MRDASSFHVMGDHSFLVDESIGDLDLDLVKSLVALDAADSACNETSLPSGSILLAAAGWFIAGVALWAVVGFWL